MKMFRAGNRSSAVVAAIVVVTAAVSCRAARYEPYPHASEPIGTVRQIYDASLPFELAVNTYRNIDRLFATRTVPRARTARVLARASTPLAELAFTDRDTTYTLDDYLRLNHVTALLILKNGQVKLERYLHGNTEKTRWMSMSIAKSVTSTLIGAAIRQGKIGGLTDPVTRYVPALAGSAYDGVTVRDVLMMASGAKWVETYTDSTSDRRRLLEAQIAQQPGGAMGVMRSLARAAPPGTVNRYSTGETQVAAELLRGAVGMSLADYLADRIWQRYGMEADANWWLESPSGTEIGGSGISATLRDYGRFGQFMLEGGVGGGEQVLPDGWTREATTPKALRGGARIEYGYLWWTAETDAGRRDEAYAAEGIFGQFIYVNPMARVVAVVWSARPHPTQGFRIRDWAFFDAVADALRAP